MVVSRGLPALEINRNSRSYALTLTPTERRLEANKMRKEKKSVQ
jgi:hypothetical protein